MRVLVLSKDRTLFSSDRDTPGDSRQRHIGYATALRRRMPGGEMRVICYTESSSRLPHYEQVDSALTLFGTSSFHRATYLCGVLKRLRPVLAGGWRPDIVTAQTPWEEGTLGLLLARLLGAKFISQLHFDIFSSEWVAESPLNRARRSVATYNMKRADGVRVVSTVLKSKVIQQLGIDERRVSVHPVGVRFQAHHGYRSDFKRALDPALVNRTLVLFVGRLCSQKNLPLLVDVAQRIVVERPDTTFVVAGEGPMEAVFRADIEQRQLSPYFHFLGRRGYETLPAVFAAADMFLLTSHYEGFGRVLAEAYLSGVPAVSTRCTGPEDIIQHGMTGFLCDRGDAACLAEAALALLESEEMRVRFGERGKMFVEERFDADRLCDQLVESWKAVFDGC